MSIPDYVKTWPGYIKCVYNGMMPKSELDADGYLWEFAYGSNINNKVFKQKRGLKAVQQELGIIKDWKLTMDHGGIPFAEPGFGNVQPCIGAELHGVMHQMSYEDFIKLQRTEGGGGSRPGYFPIKLKAISYEGVEREVWVFKTHLQAEESAYTHIPQFPSNRYLSIIREGAKDQGIKQDYLEFLDQYEDNDMGKKPLIYNFFKILFSLIFGSVLILLFGAGKLGILNTRMAPCLVFIYDVFFKKVAWFVYDILPKSVHKINYDKLHHSKLYYEPKK